MRKKIGEDRVVTESVLNEVLEKKKVVTESVLNEVLERKKVVTESVLNVILDRRFAEFKKELKAEIKAEIMFEVDLRFESFGYKMEEMFTKWSSKMFDRIDPLLREIEIAREDREIGTYKMGNMSDKLDNHEERIGRLEGN